MRITSTQYLEIQDDVREAGVDPLFHCLTGVIDNKETRCISYPDELDTEAGQRKYYDARPDVHNAYFDTYGMRGAWVHYCRNGFLENMDAIFKPVPPTPPQPPTPPTPPVPPGPYPQGLSLVFESSDPKECFCALETSAGLQIGRYGLNKGGADILLNGKVEQVFPDRESVYDFHMPPDGMPLLITEHYASVFKKINGTWQQRYARAQQDLMLSIKPAADGSIWALWRQWEGTTSGLVRSFDQGMTWHEVKTFPGFVLNGLCIDGNEVSMVGRNDTGEVLIDINGNILTTTPNWYLEYTNWSVCKADGLWNIGTWNCRDRPQENGDGIEGFINNFDGTNTTTSWGGDQWPFMQDMIIHLGKRWCIGTYGWDDASGRPSILLSSQDGRSWKKECDIPCSHVMGLNAGKEGVYISGGKHDTFGRVYHYKLQQAS